MSGFRKAVTIVVVTLLAVFLQAAVFGTFFPRWMVPNLCLVVVVFLGIFETTILGAVLAFIVGLALDLSSGQLIGPWSGSFVTVFGVLTQFGRRLFVDSTVSIAIIVFAASVFGSIVYVFLLSQFRVSMGDIFSLTLFGSSCMAALSSPIVFGWLKRSMIKKTHGRYL